MCISHAHEAYKAQSLAQIINRLRELEGLAHSLNEELIAGSIHEAIEIAKEHKPVLKAA